jgi:YfiH family protein
MPITDNSGRRFAPAADVIKPWGDDPALFYGFLGRSGGVSRGAFATLNLSPLVGDHQADVQTNWGRLLSGLPPHIVVSRLNQVHQNLVITGNRDTARELVEADGQVTAEPGLLLGIFTADCVPILLHDPRSNVVGALHAGWRGVVSNIASAGIAAMLQSGAQARRVRAALGPAIGPCCFEVGDEVSDRFRREVVDSGSYIHPADKPAKSMIDLKGIIQAQLGRAGIEPGHIADVGLCTKCNSHRFFSRRALGGRASGLQLSYIGLRS